MEARWKQLEVYVPVQYTFGADLYAKSGAYYQKFLHRSSGGSFLRVRCWLGSRRRIPATRYLGGSTVDIRPKLAPRIS